MSEGIKIDEFAFILLGGLILILVLTIGWSTTYQINIGPSTKTLTIARGSYASFNLQLNGSSSNVSLTGTGDIAGWISFDHNNFDVSGSTTVEVTVTIPFSAQLKNYFGGVTVEYGGGQKSMSIIVNVSTVTITETTHRVFGPENFVVRYAAGTDIVSEKRDFRVEKGLFTDKYMKFAGIISDSTMPILTGGYIYLVVDDTNYLGNLIVDLNGNEVFNDKADVGQVPIDLDLTQLQKGNVITIKAASPGWNFWTNNFYQIADAKFGIYYEGISFKDFTFTIDSNDINNFKEGRLSFVVSDYDPAQLNDMTIKINDNVIFSGVPTLTYFTTTFGSSVLNVGENKISFSVERGSFYDLQHATLTIARNL